MKYDFWSSVTTPIPLALHAHRFSSALASWPVKNQVVPVISPATPAAPCVRKYRTPYSPIFRAFSIVKFASSYTSTSYPRTLRIPSAYSYVLESIPGKTKNAALLLPGIVAEVRTAVDTLVVDRVPLEPAPSGTGKRSC